MTTQSMSDWDDEVDVIEESPTTSLTVDEVVDYAMRLENVAALRDLCRALGTTIQRQHAAHLQQWEELQKRFERMANAFLEDFREHGEVMENEFRSLAAENARLRATLNEWEDALDDTEEATTGRSVLRLLRDAQGRIVAAVKAPR